MYSSGHLKSRQPSRPAQSSPYGNTMCGIGRTSAVLLLESNHCRGQGGGEGKGGDGLDSVRGRCRGGMGLCTKARMCVSIVLN